MEAADILGPKRMKQRRHGRTLKRVLVVHKDSTFKQEAIDKADSSFLRLIEEGNKAVCNMAQTHEQHYRSIDAVRRELERRGIEVSVINRNTPVVLAPNTDLVVTVGGDGTFLHAARQVGGVPMLGVNSAKPSSLGHYCLADSDTFASILDAIDSGHLRWHKIARLQLVLNGKELPVPVLNEVLVHDACPAGTARYILTVRGREEVQRSTGIYIGPAAGTTAVMRSAGGKILPITQRQFQYLVREPGMRPTESWKLLRGILSAGEELKVLSQMPDGMLYLDGKYGVKYDFKRGDELVVKLHPVDVWAYVDTQVNRRYQEIR